MTLPRGTEVKERYFGNSGDPTDVIGVSGSAGNVVAGVVGDLIANAFVTYYNMASFTGLGMLPAYFASGSLSTATPDGTTGEKTKSPEQVAFEKRRARLVGAIRAMSKSAPNWSGLTPTRINEVSAQSAEKFVNCLPGNAILPRVAPDGEGDIMFVWGDASGRSPDCVVTVEKRALHLARGLGTSHVEQVDAQRFLGVKIPDSILERIPSK